MKRIIWVAQDKKHKIVEVWYKGCIEPFISWKREVKSIGAYYITKHYIEV